MERAKRAARWAAVTLPGEEETIRRLQSAQRGLRLEARDPWDSLDLATVARTRPRLRRWLGYRLRHPYAADDPRRYAPFRASDCGHHGIADLGEIECQDCGRLSWNPTHGTRSAWCDPCVRKRLRGLADFAAGE